MAKKGKRGKRKFTLPLAVIAGLAAGLAKPVQLVIEGNYEHAMYTLTKNYTGFNYITGAFNPADLQNGLLPLVLGGLIHKFVGGPPLNLNKMLAAAGVPVIRI